MAGILDFLGQGDPSGGYGQGGILGGASQQTAPSWAAPLGMFGAALKDAGASFGGHPADANNVQQYSQQYRQMQMQQGARQVMMAMQSNDPDARQQAYTMAPMFGIDPSVMQKMQAQKALPQMMANLQPQQTFNNNPVAVTPEVTANPTQAQQQATQAAQAINAGPATSMQPSTFAGAIQRTGVPELSAMFAPDIARQAMEQQDKSVHRLSDADAQAAGYPAGAPVYSDNFGHLTSSLKPTAEITQSQDALRTAPITPYQQKDLQIKSAEANKPVAVGLNGLYLPGTGKMIGGPAVSSGSKLPDPTAPNITGQTGLSPGAFNYLVGNTSALPRDAASRRAIQAEANDYLAKSGTDISSLQSQYKAFNNVLQNNQQRNNQSGILENEIQGSIGNLAPLATAIGQGKVNALNVANVWAGKQLNDPNVQQYRDQLIRLRSELAGYNAIAAGKMTENGQARTDDGDLREAEQVISNGLNAGSAQGLGSSIAMTTAKNRAVLGNAIDGANKQIWDLFGVGGNYKPRNGSPTGPAGGAPPPSASNLPRVSQPGGQTKSGVKFQILGQ